MTARSSPSVSQLRTSLDAEKLTTLVNQWRVKSGFQPYTKLDSLCRIAQERVQEQKNGLDYHKGLLEQYSKYPSIISENVAGPVSEYMEEAALYSWLTSKDGHREALEYPFQYSCVATYGLFAEQIFSNCENGCP